MKTFYWLTPLVLLTVTQFNNCSPYAQSDNSQLSSLGSLVCDADCITPDPTTLSVTPNLFEGASLRIPGGLGDFDIGGVCNEGGFAYNVITWELYDSSNTKVRDSSAAGANSRCVNGRFKAYVKLTPIGSDQNDRTGLHVNGQSSMRQQYTLQFSIYGQLVQNGALQMGTNARRGVTLIGI